MSFTIQMKFQMLSYWSKQLLLKILSHRNLLAHESIQNFIKGQQQMSTVKKTMYDMHVFQNFLCKVEEEREVLSLPPAELDKPLCNSYITDWKKE